MKTSIKTTIGTWTAALESYKATAQRCALALLCGLLLVTSSLAQEGRPEPLPEQVMPEAAPAEKPPDPNETITPSPQANQSVDGDIVFTSPGQFTYPRDIRLSDNFGGLRLYGANSLTTSPAGAAIQFFGNNASPFNGQLYLDSGAHNSAALIFRTAQTGGTITERMRIRADGRVTIGTTDPQTWTLRVFKAGTQDGIVGETNVDVGYGVTGIASGSSATGVFGFAPGSNGYGVRGTANGSDGVGVSGFSSSGVGIHGESSTNRAVEGFSGSGIGVIGDSSTRGVVGTLGRTSCAGNYAVGGCAPAGSTDLAGYFRGNVTISGNLSKGSGSFKIDHPLDPENKYLSHSFVESPDMMNIYNGNVTLDRRGRATVTLPAYFAALNREFRYQLTAVGTPGPNLYIARKIKGNEFRIAGGKRGMEVSWMVTGIRQDAYATAHPIKVEEEKTGAERGAYLHPEVFGQSKEKGIGHARNPELLRPPQARANTTALTSKRVAAGRQ